jgi:hypothetical protein
VGCNCWGGKIAKSIVPSDIRWDVIGDAFLSDLLGRHRVGCSHGLPMERIECHRQLFEFIGASTIPGVG